MENPIKIRRLLAGWTQDQLAAYAGVTHDNVVRNEQGLFNSPSPAVLEALVTYTGDSEQKIKNEYTAWIAHKRRSEPIRTLVKRNIHFNGASDLPSHPFYLWRTSIAPGVSRIGFCQMLCVHPATVLKYETGQQRPMPSQIFTALIECGMDSGKVHQLAMLGEEYFVHQRRRRLSA